MQELVFRGRMNISQVGPGLERPVPSRVVVTLSSL
jgi:hypothetical protein